MSTYENPAARYLGALATDAALRDYLTDFHTTMTSSGWAVTSDTGQIDESTVVYGVTTNVTWGYRMYKLDDSLGSTYPIYLKVTHGCTSNIGYVCPTIQFGISTDGAGTITGPVIYPSGNLGSLSASDQIASLALSLGSFGEGYSYVFPGRDVYSTSYNDGIFFGVSRQFDNDGNLMSNGNFTVFSLGLASHVSSCKVYSYIASHGVVTGGVTNSVSFCPLNGSDVGSTVELYPVYTRYGNPSIVPGFATYKAGTLSLDATIQATLVGSTPRTYRTLPNEGFGFPNSNTKLTAILWE